MHNGSKGAGVAVVGQVNLVPVVIGASNTGTQAAVGQEAFGYIGDQRGIADIGIAGLDFLDG